MRRGGQEEKKRGGKGERRKGGKEKRRKGGGELVLAFWRWFWRRLGGELVLALRVLEIPAVGCLKEESLCVTPLSHSDSFSTEFIFFGAGEIKDIRRIEERRREGEEDRRRGGEEERRGREEERMRGG